MQYLTDKPELTIPFLPPDSNWLPCAAETLTPQELAAWKVFGGGAQAWRCRAAPGARHESQDRTVLIVENAPQSQFSAALEALNSGVALPERLACLALSGSGFRGQRERTWTAMKGNLHLTALYNVSLDAARVQPALAMLPAVAAADGIRSASESRLSPSIKWVNDIILGGRKVAGVLTASLVKGDGIERALFGIGANLDVAPVIGDAGRLQEPGAIADFDPQLRGGLPRLFAAVMDALDSLMPMVESPVGRAELFERYRARADFIGRDVCIIPPEAADMDSAGHVIHGRVKDLLPDLSLALDGQIEPVRCGRMVYAN